MSGVSFSTTQATTTVASGSQAQAPASSREHTLKISWKTDEAQVRPARLASAAVLSLVGGGTAAGVYDAVAHGALTRMRGSTNFGSLMPYVQRAGAIVSGAGAGAVGAMAASRSSTLAGSVGYGAAAGAATLFVASGLFFRSGGMAVQSAVTGMVAGAAGGLIEHWLHD